MPLLVDDTNVPGLLALARNSKQSSFAGQFYYHRAVSSSIDCSKRSEGRDEEMDDVAQKPAVAATTKGKTGSEASGGLVTQTWRP